MMYAMAQYPDHFESRVESAVALAPAVYMINSNEKMLQNLSGQSELQSLLYQMDFHEIMGKNSHGEEELMQEA